MITSIIRRYKKLDVHTSEVIRKSFLSMIVKLAGMLAVIGISLFLGRNLGAEGLGIISLANRIVALALVFVMFGLPQAVVKYVAIGYEANDWEKIGNTVYTASLISGVLASLICILGYKLSHYISITVFGEPELEIPLKIAFIVMIPQAMSRIYGSSLNGCRKIWQSNLVNETLSMWIVAILLMIIYFYNFQINVVNIAIIYAIGRTVVTIVVILYWKTLSISYGKRKLVVKPMIKMSIPLLLVSSTAVIAVNSDSIMLGWLTNSTEVGLYTVGSRLALLSTFFLLITNSAISPKIASLYYQGKLKDMEKMVQRVTYYLVVIALIFTPIFFIFGRQILSLWGSEFSKAYWVLIILSIGQLFNISTGAVGHILIMCGKEKILGNIKLIEVVSNIFLNYVLIIKFDAIGAAIATSTTLICLNITKVIYVHNILGIKILKLK